MEKFVPFEKLSKKKKKELNAKKRGSWHGVNPATRRSENPKAYKRKKIVRWSEDSSDGFLFCFPNLLNYYLRCDIIPKKEKGV